MNNISPFLSLSSYFFIYILRYWSKLQFENVGRQIFLTNMFSSWKIYSYYLSLSLVLFLHASKKTLYVLYNKCYISRSSELSRKYLIATTMRGT